MTLQGACGHPNVRMGGEENFVDWCFLLSPISLLSELTVFTLQKVLMRLLPEVMCISTVKSLP